MKETHYKLAMGTMWKGLRLFISSWGVTLDVLLRDLLRGVAKHWFFAVTLVAIYVLMFFTMAQSRAMFHHGEAVNYQLSQAVDSLELIIK